MRVANVVVLILFAALANGALGASVTIPAGTRIFGELQEEVSSDVKEFDVGDIVMGRVWRNVVVDGQTVIPAGTPMTLQISAIKKRKTFGRGGSVEIRAMSVTAADGTEVFLDGGYDRQGDKRIVLSATLFALVAWPTAFIKGKEAILPAGTVFDAAIPANTNVSIPDGQRPVLRLGSRSNLSVEILYDELTEDSKELPMQATLCNQSWAEPFQVDEVNDAAIEPLQIRATESASEGNCQTTTGLIGLKDLSEHFAKGINRFIVRVGAETTEVILDVEM